jgi:hypothetical protein
LRRDFGTPFFLQVGRARVVGVQDVFAERNTSGWFAVSSFALTHSDDVHVVYIFLIRFSDVVALAPRWHAGTTQSGTAPAWMNKTRNNAKV